MPRSSIFIVILNWNGWQDTIRCLESVFELDYPEFHVVVCDNGSGDGSLDYIESWATNRLGVDKGRGVSVVPVAQAGPTFQVIQNGSDGDGDPRLVLIDVGNNLGFAGGCNVGIRYAKRRNADFVWLLNNDAVADPRALAALMETMAGDQRIGAVGSVIVDMAQRERVQVWGGGKVNRWVGSQKVHLGPVDPSNLDFLTGASLLLRVEALDDVGSLDDAYFMYWEDVDLCFRLRQRGWKLAVAEGSRIFHKESASLSGNPVLLYTYYFSSAKRFCFRFAFVPWFAITVGIGGRILKHLVGRDWSRLRAMWNVLVGRP